MFLILLSIFFNTAHADDQYVWKINRLSNIVKVACQKEKHSVCDKDYNKLIQNHWKVYCSRNSKEQTPEGFKKDFDSCYSRLLSRKEGLLVKPINKFLNTSLEHKFLRELGSKKEKLSFENIKKVELFIEKELLNSKKFLELKSPFVDMYYACPRNKPFSDCLLNFRSEFSAESLKRHQNRFSYLGRLKKNLIDNLCEQKIEEELGDVLKAEKSIVPGRYGVSRLFCFYKANMMITKKLFQFAKKENPFSESPIVTIPDGDHKLSEKSMNEFFQILRKYPLVDIEPEYQIRRNESKYASPQGFMQNKYLILASIRAQDYLLYKVMCSIPYNCSVYFKTSEYRLRDRYGVGTFVKDGIDKDERELFKRVPYKLCEGQVGINAKAQCTLFFDEVFWRFVDFYKKDGVFDRRYLSIFDRFKRKMSDEKNLSIKERMNSNPELEKCGPKDQASFYFEYEKYPFTQQGIPKIIHPECPEVEVTKETKDIENIIKKEDKPTLKVETKAEGQSKNFSVKKQQLKCSEKYCLIYIQRKNKCKDQNAKDCYISNKLEVCKEALPDYHNYQAILYHSCSK